MNMPFASYRGNARAPLPKVLALALVGLMIVPNQVRAAPGDLDTSFGTGGKVTTDFAGEIARANAVALQTDGKPVAAGGSFGAGGPGSSDFALARYEAVGEDTTAPVITIAANPAMLWPPNGRLVPVTVSGTITDEPAGSGVNASSAAYMVLDQYGQHQPRGSITLDANGRYTVTVSLEASRRGNDQDGRHYTIIVGVKDNVGNPAAASTIVTVPHDQGQ